MAAAVITWFSLPAPALTWFGQTVDTVSIVQNQGISAVASVVGARGPQGLRGPAGASAPGVFTSPVFSYTAGLLTGITYAGGQTKTLTYTAGLLSTVVLVNDGVTSTKTLNYTAGVLTSITQT